MVPNDSSGQRSELVVGHESPGGLHIIICQRLTIGTFGIAWVLLTLVYLRPKFSSPQRDKGHFTTTKVVL
jgi:hypothetical protein